VYYVDESGSIPSFKSKKWKNRYFLIAFVHTEDKEGLKKVHNRSLKNVRKYYPHLFDENNELKASVAPPFIKEYLLRRIIDKTDAHFGYMIVDNWNIKERFRKYKSRSFNYLIKLVMISHDLCDNCSNYLVLNIDNRNSKITSLSELEGHLFDELVLSRYLTNDINVNYLQSHETTNVQVADLIANTIYQYYRYKGVKFKINNLTKGSDDHCPQSYKHLFRLIQDRFFFYQEFPFGRSKNNVTLKKSLVKN